MDTNGPEHLLGPVVSFATIAAESALTVLLGFGRVEDVGALRGRRVKQLGQDNLDEPGSAKPVFRAMLCDARHHHLFPYESKRIIGVVIDPECPAREFLVSDHDWHRPRARSRVREPADDWPGAIPETKVPEPVDYVSVRCSKVRQLSRARDSDTFGSEEVAEENAARIRSCHHSHAVPASTQRHREPIALLVFASVAVPHTDCLIWVGIPSLCPGTLAT